MRDDGQFVHQSNKDADTMNVQCVLQYAIEGNEVNVFADDTDATSDLVEQGGPIVTLYLLFCMLRQRPQHLNRVKLV